MSKKALICGISGQDGAYLAKLLLSYGYKVFGTSRNVQSNDFVGLERLKIKSQIKLISMTLDDINSVSSVASKIEPDEIYNLAGQTSVNLSFKYPVETMESISAGVLNLLEFIRNANKKIRLYNACSGECFGDTGNNPATEKTPFKPRSPYAAAKAASFWQVEIYREAYDIYACSGLLFNHESPLRPQHFVTQKIIHGVKEISKGKLDKITLGNLDISRDWGYAEDYVEAMWKMLQIDKPTDFIIATGKTYSLRDFVKKSFDVYCLDWKKYVNVDKSFFRPLDLNSSKASPEKAKNILGWEAKHSLDDLIQIMMK
jgi:GDPmannose 4,6-dehydratase